MRPIGHCQDFSSLWPHQNNGGFLRGILLHRGIDFVLDDVLQTQIDSQMDLITIARSALLSPVRNNFLSGAIVFDETIAVLPMKILLHGRFDALDAIMIEVSESNDVAKHQAIWVDARRIVLEVNTAQITGAKFFAQSVCRRLWYLAFDHDVTAIAV